MVTISDVPMLSTGVMQDRVGLPSTCTVHAPHSARPQPNLVPVMPSTSRSTQSSGVSPSTSTLCAVPLTLMVKAMGASQTGAVRIVDKRGCGLLVAASIKLDAPRGAPTLDLIPFQSRLTGHICHLLG